MFPNTCRLVDSRVDLPGRNEDCINTNNTTAFLLYYRENAFVELLTTKIIYALFPVGTIFSDSHHFKSPTRREQGLNLRRI